MNLHDPLSWIPPADTEKATADWDVAEAVCDKVAFDTKLTVNESADLIDDAFEPLSREFGHFSEGVAAGMMLIQTLYSSTAGERKKREVFVTCMEELGWQRSSYYH